jgi:hypothetical protein
MHCLNPSILGLGCSPKPGYVWLGYRSLSPRGCTPSMGFGFLPEPMPYKEVGSDSISRPSSLGFGLELPHSRTLSLSPLLYILLGVPSLSPMSVFLAYIAGMFWAYLGGGLVHFIWIHNLFYLI